MTSPVWDRVKPVKTPMANRGMSVVGVAIDRYQQDAGQHGQHPDPVAEDQPVAAHPEEVGQVVVPGQQAGQDG